MVKYYFKSLALMMLINVPLIGGNSSDWGTNNNDQTQRRTYQNGRSNQQITPQQREEKKWYDYFRWGNGTEDETTPRTTSQQRRNLNQQKNSFWGQEDSNNQQNGFWGDDTDNQTRQQRRRNLNQQKNSFWGQEDSNNQQNGFWGKDDSDSDNQQNGFWGDDDTDNQTRQQRRRNLNPRRNGLLGQADTNNQTQQQGRSTLNQQQNGFWGNGSNQTQQRRSTLNQQQNGVWGQEEMDTETQVPDQTRGFFDSEQVPQRGIFDGEDMDTGNGFEVQRERGFWGGDEEVDVNITPQKRVDLLVNVRKRIPNAIVFFDKLQAVEPRCLFPRSGFYTIIIPTDRALDRTILAKLEKKSPEEICTFLTHYIIPEKIVLDKIQRDQTFTTVAGNKIVIKKKNGKYLIGKTEIVAPSVDVQKGLAVFTTDELIFKP